MSKAKGSVIIDVGRSNVDQTGFFCYMSKRRSEGFLRKMAWVKARFDEGMRIKMLEPPERGFIEYIPGEYAWRALNAPGHMVIHCLWVVGRSKGKGLGGLLLEACIADARKAGMCGTAMVASPGNWLAGRRIFEKHGFKAVSTAPPSFVLMVKRLGPGPAPSFPRDWEARAAHFGDGLTVVTSGQCPYHPAAVENLLAAAAKGRIKARAVELRTAREVQALSPTPYGAFSIVLDGKLIGYHYLTQEKFLQAVKGEKFRKVCQRLAAI
jgi:L-amino acid N-acyltransferase YncA